MSVELKTRKVGLSVSYGAKIPEPGYLLFQFGGYKFLSAWAAVDIQNLKKCKKIK